MKQLRMEFHGSDVKDFSLPEGFSIEYYSGKPEQEEDWINICKSGEKLLSDDPHRDFHDDVLFLDGVKAETDLIFIVSPEGERAATITFFICPEDNKGLLHMVCCKEKFRGKGIGNAMTSYAMSQLLSRGARTIGLTTDDFRIPAIRSYLRFGFLPVLEGEGMKERWDRIFEVIGKEKNK